MNQLQPFARVPSRAAKAARPHPSQCPCRAATSIIHHQHQTWSDTEQGLARFGMCQTALGVAKAVRCCGQGLLHIDLLPTGRAFGLGRSLSCNGIGTGANQSLASIHNRRKGTLQSIAKRHPSHFRASFRSPSLDSPDANENGLTDAQIQFAPGAKAYD